MFSLILKGDNNLFVTKIKPVIGSNNKSWHFPMFIFYSIFTAKKYEMTKYLTKK